MHAEPLGLHRAQVGNLCFNVLRKLSIRPCLNVRHRINQCTEAVGKCYVLV